MRTLSPNEASIEEVRDVLKRGGVVAHATETCYGLACDLTNPDAVERLFGIKRRPANLPVSALFPSIEEAKRYVEWNDRAEELARDNLPGPLTLILPSRKDAPFRLFLAPRHTGTVGVRVSSHPLAFELVQAFGRPLSTTSANISGQPNLYSIEEIKNQFKNAKMKPDIVLDSGQLPRNPPSRVIDLSGEGEIVVRT